VLVDCPAIRKRHYGLDGMTSVLRESDGLFVPPICAESKESVASVSQDDVRLRV
jgi:hypothetical protein